MLTFLYVFEVLLNLFNDFMVWSLPGSVSYSVFSSKEGNKLI